MTDGIIGNLTGLFDTVNQKVGEIAGEVGATPQGWNAGIFNMIRSLSETVIIPIAGAILAFVMCYELIQMVTEKNNIPWMLAFSLRGAGWYLRNDIIWAKRKSHAGKYQRPVYPQP